MSSQDLVFVSDFVQDNQSFSVSAGTVRGLHFQIPPFQQAKLVRVLRGKIFDVVVDLRRSSATYGKHIGVELSADGGEQLFVPRGFAHGFCTLVENTEIFYKVDAVYSAAHDRGVHWLDPKLGIHWPIETSRGNFVGKGQDPASPQWSLQPFRIGNLQ